MKHRIVNGAIAETVVLGLECAAPGCNGGRRALDDRRGREKKERVYGIMMHWRGKRE